MRKPTFWFLTWSDTNQAVQLQKMASDLENRGIVLSLGKTKALIATAMLIRVFVFTYAKCWFSHDTAQFSEMLLE